MATLGVCQVMMRYPLLTLILPFMIYHFYQILISFCWRSAQTAIIFCQNVSNDKWQLVNRAGEIFWVKKIDKAFRSPWFIILQFQQLRTLRKITVVIASDAVPKHIYRQLLSSLWNQ